MLINPENKRPTGRLKISSLSNLPINLTLRDYISSGLHFSLLFCIDFTKSNIIPSQQNSLHYVGGNK